MSEIGSGNRLSAGWPCKLKKLQCTHAKSQRSDESLGFSSGTPGSSHRKVDKMGLRNDPVVIGVSCCSVPATKTGQTK